MTSVLLILALSTIAVLQESSPQVVRVGVVAYEDFHDEREQFSRFFAELSDRDPRFRFRVAVGSYSEVSHWIDGDLVDVAVMTPGAFASVIGTGEQPPSASQVHYLSSMQLPSATSKWASADRRKMGYHDSYSSICLVAETSDIQSIDDLREAVQDDRVEILLVHPLSLSGHTVPLRTLASIGIKPTKEQIRFTYSHAQSIRELKQPKTTASQRVAFVWDDASASEPESESGIRRLPFAELEAEAIPTSVIVCRSDFQSKSTLASLLEGAECGRHRFAHQSDWRDRFSDFHQSLASPEDSSLIDQGQRVSLDGIGQTLLQYSRSQPQPLRLALVLSGGGAKCSYQVGAVEAIEEKLSELRQESGLSDLDIGLVVGTSGGAINSVPIAMGVTQSERGRRAFRETWRSLDQRAIVQPSFLIRINMGLWLAMLQSVVVLTAVNLLSANRSKRLRVAAVAFISMGLAQILVAYLPPIPWRTLGDNHAWHHVWLWMTFGIRTSAWCLLMIGSGLVAVDYWALKRHRVVPIAAKLVRLGLLGGLLGLPLLQAITIFFYEETLSGGRGMQIALADGFSRVIDHHLSQQNRPPLESDSDASAEARLQSMSRQIFQRHLLTRDLVVTGSCIGQNLPSLPTDLYFYAAADAANDPPPYGDRGLSLVDRPQILLDVVMGSGSIFPIFPSRTLHDFPDLGHSIELVDGGFAHNSPIEAAVLWGATHVILIEATPRKQPERGNFLKNVASSYSHLYRQAQLLDTHSRGKVVIFGLSPQPPHLCVLDFAENLISASIAQGYRDASGDALSVSPMFVKEFGEPVFVDAVSVAVTD